MPQWMAELGVPATLGGVPMEGRNAACRRQRQSPYSLRDYFLLSAPAWHPEPGPFHFFPFRILERFESVGFRVFPLFP